MTAVEVQEDLNLFQDKTMEQVRKLNNDLAALENEVRLLEKDREDKEDSWEAASNRVSNLVDDSVSALSDCLTELEHTVQSRMTTPVTEESTTHVEVWTTIEQKLVSEISKVKDEHSQTTSRLFELVEKLHENQKSQERQLTGLRSFAQHVEQFLDRISIGATAPSDSHRAPRLEGHGTNAPQRQFIGASSSSTRPSSYLEAPRPPTVPAPPVPRENESTSPSEPSRVSTTHFSTVRSDVRSGAIRIDITNPEQWSPGGHCDLAKSGSKEGVGHW